MIIHLITVGIVLLMYIGPQSPRETLWLASATLGFGVGSGICDSP